MKKEYNKRRLVYALGIILVVMAVAVPTTMSMLSENIYVSASQLPSWYDETHVSTIRDAMAVANDGDTIHIWSGTYQETVFVYKQVEIIGSGADTTTGIGVPPSGGCSYGTFTVLADNVEIHGLSITNGYVGIWMISANTYVHDNHIYQNNVTGIEVNSKSAYNCIIEKNVFYDNPHRSIYLKTGARNNIVQNNEIQNGEFFGIQVKASDGNSITNNDISNCNGMGIKLSGSSGNTVTGNAFSDCSQDVVDHDAS